MPDTWHKTCNCSRTFIYYRQVGRYTYQSPLLLLTMRLLYSYQGQVYKLPISVHGEIKLFLVIILWKSALVCPIDCSFLFYMEYILALYKLYSCEQASLFLSVHNLAWHIWFVSNHSHAKEPFPNLTLPPPWPATLTSGATHPPPSSSSSSTCMSEDKLARLFSSAKGWRT